MSENFPSRLVACIVCTIMLHGAAMAVDVGTAGTLTLPVEGSLPALDRATAWIGSPPLTARDLRGKVVLVDFWTYSCINWMRTSPYVRAWADKYKDQGLVVIGVHTPEFDFEKDVDNVREMALEMRVGYPIAIDNSYAIWNAFRNAYWPALYFIDARGQVRHHQFGEGDYEHSERVIQQLLAEANGAHPASASHDLVSIHAVGLELAADWADQKSPETYVGRARAENFISFPDERSMREQVFATHNTLKRNQWGLSGEWTIEDEFATPDKPGGRIVYRFHARDLHLVMAPGRAGSSMRFRLLLDGKPPGKDADVDIDESGAGTVTSPRLYQLIRQVTPDRDRQFEIEFLEPGVRVYSFTFG